MFDWGSELKKEHMFSGAPEHEHKTRKYKTLAIFAHIHIMIIEHGNNAVVYYMIISGRKV